MSRRRRHDSCAGGVVDVIWVFRHDLPWKSCHLDDGMSPFDMEVVVPDWYTLGVVAASPGLNRLRVSLAPIIALAE